MRFIVGIASLVACSAAATGTPTYSIGTENHPDESCTATNATLSIAPAT